MSQKLLDEVQAYGSVTILDADDLETIRQCEFSITDFQRQKDVPGSDERAVAGSH